MSYILLAFLISSSICGTLFFREKIRRIFCLAILQSSLIVLFLVVGYVKHSSVPIIKIGENVIYTDPVPSVLMLTAIVVGFCISALGYAFVCKIKSFENV